jgi:hypothetical protein
VVHYNDMEIGAFYVPHDLQFPLVDMYWKDENGDLCGIQDTKSMKHPKSFDVYKSFLQDNLDLPSMNIKFHLNFVIFPFRKDSYEAKEFPKSFFYSNLSSFPTDFGATFQFYALCPPNTFESRCLN